MTVNLNGFSGRKEHARGCESSSKRKSTNMTPFGRGLRKARIEQGWNQELLAKQIGVSQVTISHWERGEEYPSFSHLAALGGILPHVLRYAHEEELELLRRLMRAERTIFSGACGCEGCACTA